MGPKAGSGQLLLARGDKGSELNRSRLPPTLGQAVQEPRENLVKHLMPMSKYKST